MENSEWMHFTDKIEKLIEIISTVNPDIDGLIGSLQDNNTFHIFVKKNESHVDDPEEWIVAPTATIADFCKILAEKRDKIVPIGLNKQEKMWYFERVPKQV